MFGEVYGADPSSRPPTCAQGGLPAHPGLPVPGRRDRASSPAADQLQALAGLYASDDLYTARDTDAGPLPTFLGNHDMGRIGSFIASGGSDAGQLAAPRPARPRADVPHPRPAGRLLRRRAGLHRRRAATRTPGRTCSPPRSPTTSTTTCSAPTRTARDRPLRPRPTRSTGPSPTWARCARPTRRCATASRSPGTRPTARGLRLLPDRPGAAGRVRGRGQQRAPAPQTVTVPTCGGERRVRPDLPGRAARTATDRRGRQASSTVPAAVHRGAQGRPPWPRPTPPTDHHHRTGRGAGRPPGRPITADRDRRPAGHRHASRPGSATAAWTAARHRTTAPYQVYHDLTGLAGGTP